MKIVKRYFAQAFTLLLLAGALTGCAKPASSRRSTTGSAQAQTALSKSGGGGVMKNRSRVAATVLEVMPLEAPEFCLRLRIDTADTMPGYASFAKIGEEISAYPNFVRQESQAIDDVDERNKSLLQAGTLKAGDQIIAEVYYRGGQGRESVWLLMSWQRKQ